MARSYLPERWRWMTQMIKGKPRRLVADPIEARERALGWWANSQRRWARCDVCCRALEPGGGYLVKPEQLAQEDTASAEAHETGRDLWLVCEVCFGEAQGAGDGGCRW